MTAQIEFRVMELLCSRLCHDLISPVMAINNGMELMAEDSGNMADDIRESLTMSAGSAAAKLQFYRIAYRARRSRCGTGRSRRGGTLGPGAGGRRQDRHRLARKRRGSVSRVDPRGDQTAAQPRAARNRGAAT
jgi:hypothetical protein